MKGPTAIAYHGKDSSAVTKVLANFAKDHKKLKLKAGHLFGNVFDTSGVRDIANLPSREVLLATLAARLNSPLQSLLMALNEPMRSLHAALSAVSKKKESAPAA